MILEVPMLQRFSDRLCIAKTCLFSRHLSLTTVTMSKLPSAKVVYMNNDFGVINLKIIYVKLQVNENKVGVAEMRMLRWMCGKTRQDKIRNGAIRERVGVTPIVEKMVENRLRWFGHVERKPVDSVVRRVDQMERRQTIRGRGRPKKTIREVIKKDLEINGLDRSMVLDRTLWRKLIHVADPT